MISGLLALFLFLAGLVLWGGSTATFFFGQEIALKDLFCLLLGGQLIKFGYAICESEDIDRKYKTIIEKIEDKL